MKMVDMAGTKIRACRKRKVIPQMLRRHNLGYRWNVHFVGRWDAGELREWCAI